MLRNLGCRTARAMMTAPPTSSRRNIGHAPWLLPPAHWGWLEESHLAVPTVGLEWAVPILLGVTVMGLARGRTAKEPGVATTGRWAWLEGSGMRWMYLWPQHPLVTAGREWQGTTILLAGAIIWCYGSGNFAGLLTAYTLALGWGLGLVLRSRNYPWQLDNLIQRQPLLRHKFYGGTRGSLGETMQGIAMLPYSVWDAIRLIGLWAMRWGVVLLRPTLFWFAVHWATHLLAVVGVTLLVPLCGPSFPANPFFYFFGFALHFGVMFAKGILGWVQMGLALQFASWFSWWIVNRPRM